MVTMETKWKLQPACDLLLFKCGHLPLFAVFLFKRRALPLAMLWLLWLIQLLIPLWIYVRPVDGCKLTQS